MLRISFAALLLKTNSPPQRATGIYQKRDVNEGGWVGKTLWNPAVHVAETFCDQCVLIALHITILRPCSETFRNQFVLIALHTTALRPCCTWIIHDWDGLSWVETLPLTVKATRSLMRCCIRCIYWCREEVEEFSTRLHSKGLQASKMHKQANVTCCWAYSPSSSPAWYWWKLAERRTFILMVLRLIENYRNWKLSIKIISEYD